MKYHMFVIINISPNLLQNYRFSLRITQNVLSQKKKKGKMSSRRKYHNVTSLKIDVIEKCYYIRKKEFNRKQQQQ